MCIIHIVHVAISERLSATQKRKTKPIPLSTAIIVITLLYYIIIIVCFIILASLNPVQQHFPVGRGFCVAAAARDGDR